MEFRFAGKEVNIRKDDLTGDVILSPATPSGSWDEFFRRAETLDFPDDFFERDQQPASDRDLL